MPELASLEDRVGGTSYGRRVMDSAVEEHAALVALLRTRPASVPEHEITARVLAAVSARAVWAATRAQTRLPDDSDAETLRIAATDVAAWVHRGMTLLAVTDPCYPERLRTVLAAPPLLFARATLRTHDPAVSVVGSRAARERGRRIAAAIATALVDERMNATGQDHSYPATNALLQEEIAERGLVLSQFWPESPPHKHTFLVHNATLSGYGLATVVVEAGERSGARAMARTAVDHGRPLILTDAVVRANTWARALVGRHGVFVADSLKGVMDAVVGLRERSTGGLDASAHDDRSRRSSWRDTRRPSSAAFAAR